MSAWVVLLILSIITMSTWLVAYFKGKQYKATIYIEEKNFLYKICQNTSYLQIPLLEFCKHEVFFIF